MGGTFLAHIFFSALHRLQSRMLEKWVASRSLCWYRLEITVVYMVAHPHVLSPCSRRAVLMPRKSSSFTATNIIMLGAESSRPDQR